MRKTTSPIDRAYAINQAELGILEAETPEERRHFESLLAFLQVLPSPQELEEHVCCTDCEYLTLEENNLACRYENRCCLQEPEDSTPRSERMCYSPKLT